MADNPFGNYFTEDEFASDAYTWRNPNEKKTKFFVFSMTTYYGGRSDNWDKCKIEHPDSGAYSDIDLYRLKHEFLNPLHPPTDVDYHNNYTIQKFNGKIDTISQDFTLQKYDCFFFIFLTFSTRKAVKTETANVEEERLHFQDGLVSIHDIWDKIKNIEHFHGKPKVIMIQSDNYKLIHPEQRDKAGPINFEARKLPVDADRLVIQSTLPGQYYSRFHAEDRNANPSASFLIQAFLEVMEANRNRPAENQSDLLTLTIAINAKIKEKICSLEKRGIPYTDRLPYAQVSSTMTKLLYL